MEHLYLKVLNLTKVNDIKSIQTLQIEVTKSLGKITRLTDLERKFLLLWNQNIKKNIIYILPKKLYTVYIQIK